mgnify:CR=1 FL=1
MAKKKCPSLSSRKDGKWLKLVCSSPDPCFNLACQANPSYQEPDTDGEDE